MADGNGDRGWRLALKIAAPILVTFIIQMAIVGHWTGRVDAILTDLLGRTKSMSERMTEIETEIKELRRQQAYDAGKAGEPKPSTSKGN